MPDGDFRRPPQLWEQKLQAAIDVQSVGLAGSAASIVPGDVLPSPDGPGADPTPPPFPEIDSDDPAAVSVFSVIAGLSVLWSGLTTSSATYPAGVIAEIHVSDTTGFTPDASTLVGTLSAPGTFIVSGLTAGTTYYVVIVVVDEAGNRSEPSPEASAQAGFVLTSDIGTGVITEDLVSFDATAIGGIQQFVGSATPATTGAIGSTWIRATDGSYHVLEDVAGTKAWVKREWGTGAIAPSAISTLQIATGAITAASGIIADAAIGTAKIQDAAITNAKIQSLDAAKITTGTLDAARIDANILRVTDVGSGGSTVIDGGRILSGTITGRTVRTSSGVNRIELTNGDAIDFYVGGTKRFDMIPALNPSGTYGIYMSGGIEIASGGLYVAGASVDLPGVYGNNTTGIDTVGITAGYRLRRISSTQEIKYDMAPLAGTLSASVDPDRILGPTTVDPFDVLGIAPTEFSVIDDGEPTDRRVVGFIADDVAEKFPLAATHDEDGTPAGVLDTAILAALLAVVREQQTTIADLTARVEALEAV